MSFEAWCAVAGALLLGVALTRNLLQNWPLTTAAIYLGLGLLLGPLVLNKLHFEPLKHTELLERVTEVAVIISLFSAGLKLRLPFEDGRWKGPLRLALISMTLTIGMVTLVGYYALGLPLGAAVLLGAFLAPTDPVLASDVQTRHPEDFDELRFSLTGEAGFNDGTAFPFVMLGLGLLGLHELGDFAWRWVAIDVIWAIVGGLGIGALLGHFTARLVIYLRQQKHQAVGTDDFIALGLIAGAYGLAILLVTYGFLAVFAAGLALRHTERRISEAQNERTAQEENEAEYGGGDGSEADEQAMPKRADACESGASSSGADGAANSNASSSGKATPDTGAPNISDPIQLPEKDEEIEELEEEIATDEQRAPRFMARQTMQFSESLENVGELILVVWLGGMIAARTWDLRTVWLAPLLFFVLRPLAVFIGLLGDKSTSISRPFIAWFGIRGIGSLYYLFYAIEHDVPRETAQELIALVFPIVAISIVVHGLSVTPLANLYDKRKQAT